MMVFPVSSAVATAAGTVCTRPLGGYPSAEIVGRLPSFHAEEPRDILRAGVRGRGAGGTNF